MVMASRFQHTVILHIILFLQIVHLIKAQGDESAVFLDGHIGQGIGLSCKSQGWLPEPEVFWLDSKGQTRKEKVVTQNTKTSLGLFDVVSSMTLEPGSDMEVSCRIVSDLLNTASESRVLISAQGDESAVFLDGHIGQGIGLNCKSQGWFPEPEVFWLDSKGQTRKEKVVTQSTKTSLGLFDVVSSMTLEPGSDMEVSCRIVSGILETASESRVLISGVQESELGFWKAWDKAVPITVNPECRLLELKVPGAPDVENNACEPAGLSSLSAVPVLVAKEGFSAGKHYWEVE
ncbi:UNVERIFIED_CONTAM: hypothetical protein H355_002416, partial [Colinus virginianus]